MCDEIPNHEHTIEIDCEPGTPRPGDLIGTVIADTGLPLRPDVARFFGCWTWNYSDVSHKKWTEIQPILKERLTKLYNDGVIRYASW